jgi:hypothetical protein
MKKLLLLLFFFGLAWSGTDSTFSREDFEGFSAKDAPISFYLGADCPFASKIYPSVNAELYVMLFGLCVGGGPIYNPAQTEYDHWLGYQYNIGLSYHMLVRMNDNAFFKMLLIKPDILYNGNNLTIFKSEKTVDYNYITFGTKVALSTRFFEIYLEPQYIITSSPGLEFNYPLLLHLGLGWCFN